ncbi:MAG TPA: M20/M25/M40 family metallo-hydrolase [Longimicrobiales bacterium]|nr:M20/M25/M40 family metallo-hydrolase [Longimicrobiales bacterium]
MRRSIAYRLSPLLAATLLVPAAAAAQSAAKPQDPAKLATSPKVKAALDYAKANEAKAVQEQVELCEIPAPPFKEQVRAAEFKRRLEALGLKNVRIDSEGNVIGERPGTGPGPTVLIQGHLDTVFPEGTDVKVKKEGERLIGPGIGDDCRGLAVVLGAARAIQAAGVQTRGTLLFVGDVGEEGLGDLRGTKHLFNEELKGKIDYFISVDGTGLGLTKDGVGSNRYEVTFKGPGGHSYGAFGMPNPIHALGRAIAKISDFQVPKQPKVTFNVGVISGGTSVNSIPFEGKMLVDMRSPDAQALAEIDAKFKKAIQDALAEENARWDSPVKLTVEVKPVGVRPAGQQPADAPIVVTGLAAAKVLGFTPHVGASSTDANVPISLGLPGVTMDGGGKGSGAHSLGEWFEPTDSHLGTQWAILYVLSLAGVK